MTKIVSAFFIVCLFISCTNKVYNSSSWQSKQITVDGKIPEWSNPLRFYDQETGISYCISNDHYNLYLVCSISNEFMQTKILRSGLEFGIDTLGKKSFSVGVRYPIGNISEKELKTNTNPPTSSALNGKPDRSAFKLKLLAEATEIQLVGFKPQLGKFISLVDSNKSGISAAINFDMNGIMNYEAVIPFSTFYKKELTPSDSNRVFNYQIKMRGGGMRGGGMNGGGMNGGGMNGGNRMSGENGANGYQRNANISGVTKTRIKLKLAYS
jgi:hypothetical protein